MEDLSDLSEFLDVPVLTLPVHGVKYIVKSASGEDWLRLQAIDDDRATSKVSAMEMFKLALGSTFDEMVKAGLLKAEIEHCGTTAYFWQMGREDMAETFWKSTGKAVAAKSPRKTSTQRTTRPAAGTTTRRRASGTGTSGLK